jgi:large subunit ribosomal protein L25
LKEVGDSIHLRDLTIDPKITVLADPDELIVRINPLRDVNAPTEDELEAAEAAPSEPEVISKGKDDEEEEE